MYISVNKDVLIVGGGPAGLAAAIALRQRGFGVTVADANVPPVDKACGEGLMPDALSALALFGIEIPGNESFPYRGIRFVDGQRVVSASFPDGRGRGVRRTVLHQAMVERADAMGVRLCWGSQIKVEDLGADQRWVIGADGVGSRVRQWAGLGETVQEKLRYGFRRHYRIAPWSEYVEIYWAKSFQIYVTPVSADSVGVAILTRGSKMRVDDALAQVPELAARLASSEIISTERGGISVSRRLRAVCRDRVALIGDASGSVDAITGEGVYLAFRQARALADAMEEGSLARYQAEHDRIMRRPRAMARLLLALGDVAPLRGAAIRAMKACPPIFSRMLAFHVGGSRHLPVESEVVWDH